MSVANPTLRLAFGGGVIQLTFPSCISKNFYKGNRQVIFQYCRIIQNPQFHHINLDLAENNHLFLKVFF